ncbi:RICIN domain-containing protein [Streptomyces sp. NPDC001941]|uniref:RICIN domain-containing protein n=1 Tax=Streptomyces sp. NPDC001941 TaxID=3154659 RepID=UPI003333B641
MARNLRTALAAAAGLATVLGGATAAHAEPNTSYVRFQVEHSGKCLTIAGGSLADGVQAVQSTCASGLDNQLFALKPVGGGQFQVQAKHSGRCLTTGPNVSWEAKQQWCVAGSTTQKWRIQLVDVDKDLFELRPVDALEYCLTIPDNSTAEGAKPFVGKCSGLTPQRWRMTDATS